MHDLRRLIAPRSIAVIGGGAWCENISAAAAAVEYEGAIWPVHPARAEIAGRRAFGSLDALPQAPDAAFIGVNRAATVEIVSELRAMGAGGAVCFASGFGEVSDGVELNRRLLSAADGMPVLGPNCYGFVNALDRAAIWPDQHGMAPVARGVAILTQSSNIALNLTMQRRGLPIGFLGTLGNRAQVSLADLAGVLIDDDRVTALGLHIEGVGDPEAFYDIGRRAAARGKPVVVLKAGRSEAARASAVSHTASLAGSAAGASALIARAGMAEVTTLPVFLEALKALHVFGPLPGARAVSMSCSGGEAALVADMATRRGVAFPPLSSGQAKRLRAALGPKVALANPLDYHTYIWRDVPAMAAVYTAAADPAVDVAMVVADFPDAGRCDPTAWDCIPAALEQAAAATGARYALVSSLPETLPEALAGRLMARGILPLASLGAALDALAACHAASRVPDEAPPWPVGPDGDGRMIPEHEAKPMLAAHGLDVPRGLVVSKDAPATLDPPVAVKALGLAHKTEAGGVALDLATPGAVAEAAARMPGDRVLVEEMAPAGVELLVAVTRDPAHGLVLTLGAGGVLAELLGDTAHLLLPASRERIAAVLGGLRVNALLAGWRGAPAARPEAILDAVDAIQRFAYAHRAQLLELEINPLICGPDRAVAVDVMLTLSGDVP